MRHGSKATIIIPLRASSTRWRSIAPDSVYLYNFVVDCQWVPKNDPYVFRPGYGPQWPFQLQHPIGNSWLYASTSLTSQPASNSPSRTVVFKKVVIPALATLGVGTNTVPPSSGWSSRNINLDDPIEVSLAVELQSSALAHVETSTSHAYVGPWN
jgi:hypothetical protein